MDATSLDKLAEFGVVVAIVAVVAGALAVPACLVWVRSGLPFRPRWKFLALPWHSSAFLLAGFPFALILLQVVASEGTRLVQSSGRLPGAVSENSKAIQQQQELWARVLFQLPLAALGWLAWAKWTSAAQWKVGTVARNVLIGILGWLVLTPLTFTVFFFALKGSDAMGIPPSPHVLTELNPHQDGTGGVLFVLGVCLAAPIVEELLFRGMLVPWIGQRRFAPWVALAMAALLAWVSSGGQWTAMIVVGQAAVLLILVTTVLQPKRVPRRTTAAILASSAVFAAAHSAAWPTPVPLFVLGCGLGYLAIRTRSLVPGVVLHGLFNAVSFVMLYRERTP